jgi:hypothetical protein
MGMRFKAKDEYNEGMISSFFSKRFDLNLPKGQEYICVNKIYPSSTISYYYPSHLGSRFKLGILDNRFVLVDTVKEIEWE